MLIDRIKKMQPDYNFSNSRFYLKDAVIFYINEEGWAFVNRCHTQTLEETITFPSFLPHENCFLQFNDGGGLWICEGPCITDDPKWRTLSVTALPPKDKSRFKVAFSIDEPLYYFQFSYAINGLVYPKVCSAFGVESFKQQGMMETVQFVAQMLKNFLDIMSCKNIRTKKITPNKKMGKSKIRPLSPYHVLQIQQKASQGGQEPQDLWSNRVHLCRGHIKTYTKEKPLFGKYVGNVWCPPHARGNKDLGVIHKDYALTGS